jgi:hypothetical protein
MSRVRSFLASCALVAMCPSLAYAGGTLPIYPHSDHGGQAREPISVKYTNQAVGQGDTAGLYTDDSVAKVDAWYRSRLPKSCTHTSVGDDVGGQYKCGDRVVTILRVQGRTSIVLGPRM